MQSFSRVFFMMSVSISMALMSCSDKQVLYLENQKTSEDYSWKKSDIKTFKIPVTNNGHGLEMALHLRYATGYAYKNLLLKITEIDPNGEKTIRDVDVQMVDEKGEFIGEKGFDIIDLRHVLDREKNFPMIGEYTYTVESDMPNLEVIDFIMEIGMELKDPEKK